MILRAKFGATGSDYAAAEPRPTFLTFTSADEAGRVASITHDAMVALMNTHNERPLWNRQLVLDETNLSRATIDRLERAGHFPQRVQLSPRRVAWKSDEIRTWIKSRQRACEARVSSDSRPV